LAPPPAPLPAPLRALAADPAHGALFLDFDGTLSAIVDDPVGARALPGVPALLADLAASFELVAVISGRPTAFLRQALGTPPGVELVGLYGLERALASSSDAPTAAARQWAGVVGQVVAEARATAPEGVYVEPKGLTVTLHWRHAPDEQPWVTQFAGRQHDRHGLDVHGGRMELELRPPLQVDKGTVIRDLAAERPPGRLRQVAAFGDDLGDLPAFEAVGTLGRPGHPVGAVRVAAVDHESPAEVAARADLTVDGAAGAVELLHRVAATAEAAAAPQP
jgi:trehalose 6-phosphate phosphatase